VSVQIYVLQALMIAVLLVGMCWRESVWLRLQILTWSIGVIVLALRFGVAQQLNFYSNDQHFYAAVVENLSTQQFPSDLDWWLSSAKVPYTLPAAVLSYAGIEPGLALKVVSLISLLLLTRHVVQIHQPSGLMEGFRLLFLSACGGIGMFFSLLALRETMMLLFVTCFVTTKSPSSRLLMILLIFLLRPHLAAALLVAAAITQLMCLGKSGKSANGLSALSLMVLGIISGYLLYSIGVAGSATGIWQNYGHAWGIDAGSRIASNYFGLQFLTARSETVEFSIRSLLVLRVLFSETIIIPTLFTVVLLVRPHLATSRSRLVLLSFSIYVGLATNTDFNSFRQNIPFMTAMGLVTSHNLNKRSARDSVEVSS
jgi:hypothetical protein